MTDKRIVITKHAKERMIEWQLTNSDVYRLIKEGTKEKLDKANKRYKQEKYQNNDNIRYIRNGTYLFTIADTLDKFSNQPIDLVLTITNQLINIRSGNAWIET